MNKSSEIKDLERKIEIANSELNETNKQFVKTLYPEFTDEQVSIGANIFCEKLKEITEQSQKLQESLDKCETLEDISAWRLKNNF